MNTVDVILNVNSVEVIKIDNSASVNLIPVETIQRGFMGLQTYKGVEPIDVDKKG